MKFGLPNPLVPITEVDAHNALKKEFGDKCTILLSDYKYKTTTVDEIKRFLELTSVDRYKYTSEYYDCDDFAYRLMGKLSIPGWAALPFGILWTDTPNGGHAVNFFVDINKTVWIIEPQTDDVFKLPKDWHPWIAFM